MTSFWSICRGGDCRPLLSAATTIRQSGWHSAGGSWKAAGYILHRYYDAKVAPLHLEDELGTVDVFLLPFVKPAHVRRFCEVEAAAPRSGYVPETVLAAAPEIKTYTDAIRAAITCMDINPSHRNVLVTHQFVTGAVRSDSEETSLSVGGTDNVDAAVFSDFDYVALGHIHRPQNMGGGSPDTGTGDGSDATDA